jgi:hypothetical protein
VTLKIGLAGAGLMGRRHLDALSGDGRAAIVGVADSVEAAARTAAAPFGARPCRTVGDLAEAGAEAVYITLPNAFHGAAVLEALGRGLHVFSEKPMATSLGVVLTFIVGSPDVRTLPVLLFAYLGGRSQIFTYAAVVTIVLLAPTILFLFLAERALKQEYLAAGLGKM